MKSISLATQQLPVGATVELNGSRGVITGYGCTSSQPLYGSKGGKQFAGEIGSTLQVLIDWDNGKSSQVGIIAFGAAFDLSDYKLYHDLTVINETAPINPENTNPVQIEVNEMNKPTTTGFVCNDVTWILMEESKKECERFGLNWPMGVSELIGIIPNFFHGTQAVQDFENWKQDVTNAYGFPANHLGGKVSEDGVYSYPEDPDLLPLAKAVLSPYKTVYIYSHAIVTMKHDNEVYTVRMD